MAYNLEQNFDFSPSNIFNNNNLLQKTPPNSSFNNNLMNNPLIQNNQVIEEEPTKSLQERIGLLVGKNDVGVNNIIINRRINVNPLTNMNYLNNNFIMNDLNNINNNNLNNNINNFYNNTNTTQTNEEEDDNQENQEAPYILNFNSDDDKDIEDDIKNNNGNTLISLYK